MAWSTFFGLSILLLNLGHIKNDKLTGTKINSIRCSSDVNLISNFTCKLEPKNRLITLMNMGGVLTKEIYDLRARLEIFWKNSVRYIPFLVNHTQSICEYYNGGPTVFYLNFGFKFLAKYCNVNHTCPYSGDIYCKNMLFSMNDVPAHVPYGNYRTVVKFYDHLKTIFSITVQSTLYPKSSLNVKSES